MFETYDFAPYFLNGLLYVPEKTVNLLIEAGLEREIGLAALDGLSLDEKERIGKISHTLENLLGSLAQGSEAYEKLSTEKVYFLLTGRPSASAGN